MTEMEFLSHIPVFSSLSEEGVTNLASLLRPRTKKAGEIIFRKGDLPETVYLIKTGKVAITTWGADNQELFLSMLCEGDFLGELSLFDESKRSTTAKVFEDTELLEMTGENFLAFLRSNPDVCLAMMGIIAQRVRAANVLMEHQTTKNINEEIEHHMTLGNRVAMKIATFGGSWIFFLSFASFLVLWILLNTAVKMFPPVDPFPFSFLNLLIAFFVGLQAPIILMSQNRQAEKDRIRAELDYQINLKAERQIQGLHVKMDELLMHDLQELRSLQREHIAVTRSHTESLRNRHTP